MKEILSKYMNQFTSLSEDEQQAVYDAILIEEYKKGSVLLKQGEVSSKCYFVLKGCVRQYSVNELGKEVTSHFYTEEQAIASFNQHNLDQVSNYSLACLEDSLLVVGDMNAENEMFERFSELETMTRKMTEINLGEVKDEFAAFLTSTPEERYKALLMKRPNLLERVPQYQLASYLGITPESLSRIKKRLHNE